MSIRHGGAGVVEWEGSVVMTTVSFVGSASPCFVSRGVLDYTGGLRSCLLVVLCAFLDTVAAVYLWATLADGATQLKLPVLCDAALVSSPSYLRFLLRGNYVFCAFLRWCHVYARLLGFAIIILLQVVCFVYRGLPM